MSDPTVKKALTTNQLRAALHDRYGVRPGYPVIEKAVKRGMPSHVDMAYVRRRFYLDEVIAWLESGADADGMTEVAAKARAKARTTTNNGEAQA